MNDIISYAMALVPSLLPAFIWFVMVMPRVRKTSPEFQAKVKPYGKVVVAICIFSLLISLAFQIF